MRHLGLIFIVIGGILVAFYVLYHVGKFLISGSIALLEVGAICAIVGLIFLKLTAWQEKKRIKKISESKT